MVFGLHLAHELTRATLGNISINKIIAKEIKGHQNINENPAGKGRRLSSENKNQKIKVNQPT